MLKRSIIKICFTVSLYFIPSINDKLVKGMDGLDIHINAQS